MIEYPLPIATKICSGASDVKFVYTEVRGIRFPLDYKNVRITAKPPLARATCQALIRSVLTNSSPWTDSCIVECFSPNVLHNCRSRRRPPSLRDVVIQHPKGRPHGPTGEN